MLKKQQIDIDTYVLSKPEHKSNKFAIYSYIAFGVIFVLFLVDIFNAVNLGMNGFLVYIALTFLVIYPIATKDTTPSECLLITPVGLIKRVENDLTYIQYDKITRYKFDDLNIYISCNRENITLNRETYQDVLEDVIDILEAKGKTFDPEKDYMIRDIIVVIEEGKITLEDVDEETVTEKITGKLNKKYEHLTPGYIREIIPRNSIVKNIHIVDNHMDIFVNAMQVKANHPENTTFENIEVEDCILIFENARIAQYAVKDGNEKNIPYVIKEVTLSDITDSLQESVIDEWQYGDNELIYIFKSGVGNTKIHLKYDEIIIGWNKVK